MPSVLAPEALTTLDNLKEALGIADTSQDNALERAINRATAWIESETNRKLKVRNYNGASGTHSVSGVASEDYLYFDGATLGRSGDAVVNRRGLGELFLPQFPVQQSGVSGALAFELAVLSERGSSVPGQTFDATQLVEWDDYVIDYLNGRVKLIGGVFASGIRNYRITCTAGYQTIPADLEGLCLELASQLYEDRKNLQSETIGTWSRTFNTQKEDPFVSATLAKYSLIPL
ncbi:MAG: phage head-tail connector protein [Pirellulales bacterium]